MMVRYGVLPVAVLLSLSISLLAHAEQRIGVFVGENRGYSTEEPLQYAISDARKIRNTFISYGGIDKKNAILVKDASRANIVAAIRDVGRRVAIFRKRSERAVLVFYFNGHGDRNFLHLGDDDFSREELKKKLKAVNADLVVTIIDACQTEHIGRKKGVRTQPRFDISAVPMESHEGVVTIQSTMAGKPAYEMDELRSALFTHHFASALRGAADTNGDRRITLLEAYSFAYQETVQASAENSQIIQQPHFDMTLKGAGDFVLTDLREANATVTVESNADARYLFFQTPLGQPIAEIYANKKDRVSLAMASGTVLIHKRTANGAYAAEVYVPHKGEVVVAPAHFKSIHLQHHTLKGGPMNLHPHQLTLGYSFSYEHFINDWRPVHGASLAWQYVAEKWAFQVQTELQFSAFESDVRTTEEITAGLFAMAGRYRAVKHSRLMLSVGFGAQFFRQHSTLRQSNRLQNAGLDVTTAYTGYSLAPGGTVSGEWQRLFRRRLGAYVRAAVCGAWYSKINQPASDSSLRWQLNAGIGLFLRL